MYHIHVLTALTFVVQIVNLLGSPSALCNTSLSTVNDKTVYEYGDIVHFRCVTIDFKVINTSEVSIVNLQTNVSTICNITGNACSADIGVHSLDIKGRYSCRYNGCFQDTLLSIMYIKVDPCSIPKQYNDTPIIHCVIKDMSSLFCHWSTLQTDEKCVKWQAMYTNQFLHKFICCTDDNSTTTRDVCPESGLSCLVPSNNLFFGFDYEIVLFRISQYDQESYNYTVFAGHNITQIDIYEDVEVKPGTNPRDLTVLFTLHHSPASVQGMLCNLTYISQWNNHSTIIVRVEQISLVVNKTINHLIPYTMYTVVISCKPIKSQYWSNHVIGKGQTLPSGPEYVPDIVGYSTLLTSKNQSQIYLYMKPVPVCNWYGKDLHYIVTMTTNDVSVEDRFGGESITAVLQNKQSLNSVMSLQIHSENEAGTSSIQENLSVTLRLETQHVVVVENKPTGSYVSLYSTDVYNVTSVTYYRCQGQKDTYPPICQGQVETKTVAGLMKTLFWSHDIRNISTYSWYYGITVHKHTHKNNDIVWSNCVFYDSDARRDTTLDVSAIFYSNSTSVVIVTIHFKYCDLRRKPINYLVGTWNDVTNVTKYCEQIDADFQSFNATPTTTKLHVSVDDVNNIRLCVRVQYDNDYDICKDIIPQQQFVGQQDNVTMKKLNSTEIALAALGSCIGCLLLTLFVLKLRRCRHRLMKDNTVSSNVIESILSDMYQPSTTNHLEQYDFPKLAEPVNSSGYASLELTSCPTNQHDDSNVEIEKFDSSEQYDATSQYPNTDLSSDAFPLTYSKICHNDKISLGHVRSNSERGNTSQPYISGESDSGSYHSELNSHVNYAKLQTDETSELDNDIVDTGNASIGKNDAIGDSTSNKSTILNYARLESIDEDEAVENDSELQDDKEACITEDANKNRNAITDPHHADDSKANIASIYRLNTAIHTTVYDTKTFLSDIGQSQNNDHVNDDGIDDVSNVDHDDAHVKYANNDSEDQVNVNTNENGHNNNDDDDDEDKFDEKVEENVIDDNVDVDSYNYDGNYINNEVIDSYSLGIIGNENFSGYAVAHLNDISEF